MNKILIVIFALATLFSCSKDDNSNVRIRLSNLSQYDFENITINASTGNVNYGNINSSEKSEYKLFELAYRYAFVELEVNGVILTLQPCDYVGETPLKNGNYTYELNVDTSSQFNNLTLNLIDE